MNESNKEDSSSGALPRSSPSSLHLPVTPTQSLPDIEHVTVHDDPRKWSKGRKVRQCLSFSTFAHIET